MAELAKKHGVHPKQIGTWKRAAIDNMATVLSKRGNDPDRVDESQIDKLHSKIGQLVMKRDFSANATVQLLGARPSWDLAFGNAPSVNGTKNSEPGLW